METTNSEIEMYFSDASGGKDLMDVLNGYLKDFSLASNQLESKFSMSGSSLKSILEKVIHKVLVHTIFYILQQNFYF